MLQLRIILVIVLIGGLILLAFGGYLLIIVNFIVMDLCHESIFQSLLKYKMTLILSIPVALFFLSVGGWIIAHRILKPIRTICNIAEKISVRDLGHRIPDILTDNELSRLVNVINSMLDRLEKSFHQASRFTADAAHELQTPLTILQGVLENAIQQSFENNQETQFLVMLLEEVQRLKTIVRKLLILAQADVGQLNLRLEHVNLSELIILTIDDIQAIAPHLTVNQQIKPNIMVMADHDLINLVVQNLSTNAIKYNTEKGKIDCKLTIKDSYAIFSISNTGVPISKEDQENIFNRFFRVDGSHSKRIHGSGLGLSLAREIVVAHRGDLILSESLEECTTFLLKLPCISVTSS
jgi:signal transduction histidine kinase